MGALSPAPEYTKILLCEIPGVFVVGIVGGVLCGWVIQPAITRAPVRTRMKNYPLCLLLIVNNISKLNKSLLNLISLRKGLGILIYQS
jgi:hypothetical protein